MFQILKTPGVTLPSARCEEIAREEIAQAAKNGLSGDKVYAREMWSNGQKLVVAVMHNTPYHRGMAKRHYDLDLTTDWLVTFVVSNARWELAKLSPSSTPL